MGDMRNMLAENMIFGAFYKPWKSEDDADFRYRIYSEGLRRSEETLKHLNKQDDSTWSQKHTAELDITSYGKKIHKIMMKNPERYV